MSAIPMYPDSDITPTDPPADRDLAGERLRRAFDGGVASERARLVAWLRSGCGSGDAHAVRSPSVIADMLERSVDG